MFNSIRPLMIAGTVLALSRTACVAPPHSETTAPMATYPVAEQLIAPWMTDDAPGVAVAVSLNDEVVFARGAGLANLEHSVPITPKSVFQVASVSKQITAFATLMLASDGIIDLDADIRTYLPDLPRTDPIITVRHLLDHTSGLRERNTLAEMAGWLADDIRTEPQLRALVKRQAGVNFPAGSKIEYSNTGYALLAEIVEQVSGQSFQAFTKTRIFDPLDMRHTQFPDTRNTLIPGRAASYYPSQDGFKNIIAANETIGSTGLYTTSLDLLKWAENFDTQTIGDTAVFDAMAERFQAANGEESTFAKGQELRIYKGLQTWSHGGTDAGYRSFLLRIPSRSLNISVISNRTDFDKAAFAFQLADAFLVDDEDKTAAQERDWAAATGDALAAYAGTYEVFPGVIFDLRAEQGSLTFAFRGAPRGALEPLEQIGPREFLLNAVPERSLIFDAPVDGKSEMLQYQIGMDGKLPAPRVELLPFDAGTLDLTDYVGRCVSPELQTSYDLKIVDDTLMASHARHPDFILTPYQPDTFAGEGPLQKLEFERSADGQIAGVYASAPLAERIWFSCA